MATARDIDRSFTAGRYPGLTSVLAGLQRSGQIGRVDPALDRATGRLVVHAIHPEPDASASAGPAVATALQELATFLGAAGVDLRQPPPPVWRTGFA